MISVVINRGVKIELLYLRGLGVWDLLINYIIYLTVISTFSVRLSCVNICMLCSCISLWISCRYCNLFSAHLSNLLLS